MNDKNNHILLDNLNYVNYNIGYGIHHDMGSFKRIQCDSGIPSSFIDIENDKGSQGADYVQEFYLVSRQEIDRDVYVQETKGGASKKITAGLLTNIRNTLQLICQGAYYYGQR